MAMSRYRRLTRYRRLNIAETKALLDKGYEITAADGERQFGFEVYRTEDLESITVHRAAWDNLLKSGYVKHIRSFGPRNEFHVWGKA